MVRLLERQQHRPAKARRKIVPQTGGSLFMTDDLTPQTQEELLDLGLTEDQVDEVWAWHARRSRQLAQAAGGVALVRILSHLLGGHNDGKISVRLAGLAWAYGLGHLTGYDSAADNAHVLGVSRQAIGEAVKAARKAIEGA